MKLIKAGESHGEAMTGILVGVPAGIPVDKEKINADLKERNFAYGRSSRQLAESDVIGFCTMLCLSCIHITSKVVFINQTEIGVQGLIVFASLTGPQAQSLVSWCPFPA